MSVEIEASWKKILSSEFEKPYFVDLRDFLKKEKQKKYIIYPPGKLIFNAFAHTPFDKVKVVVLGQDPYHGPGQAMGLSFSVPDDVQIPPSLQNIYKEIYKVNSISDLGEISGDLTHRADQGVLLLNAILTVRAHQAGSHRKKGREMFTDSVISLLSEKCEGVVFLLWGNYAKSKKELIDETKHHVLTAVHPSPLSASRGWFGCGHFEKTNELLEEQGLEPIKR